MYPYVFYLLIGLSINVANNITNVNSYVKGTYTIKGDFLISTNNPNLCYTGGTSTVINPDIFIPEDQIIEGCNCGAFGFYTNPQTCTTSRTTLTYGYIDTSYVSNPIGLNCTDSSLISCYTPCIPNQYYWNESRSSTVFNVLISQQIFKNPLGVNAQVSVSGTVDDELVLNGIRDNITSSHSFSQVLYVPPNGTTQIGYIDHAASSTGINVTLTYTPN